MEGIKVAKFRTLDEARKAYLDGKLTPEQFSAILKKNILADDIRKNLEKESKRIERKLSLA